MTASRKKPPDLHPAVIVARLRIAGWSLRRLSEASGLHPTTLANALRRPYPNGEKIIAHALGLAPNAIWPSRYSRKTPNETRG